MSKAYIAFWSEVDTGSREENASEQKLESGSDSVSTGLQRVRATRTSIGE
jgi:hypothetical protein